MRDQDAKALIAYRLDEANEALGAAELLLDARRHRSAGIDCIMPHSTAPLPLF
jgi:hypothetical protein